MELPKTFFVLSALLMSSVDAQDMTQKGLQPWLLGLTVVVGFLLIVFILMQIRRLWYTQKRSNEEEEFGDTQSTESPSENFQMKNAQESSKEEEGHTNKALEPDEKPAGSSDAAS